MRTARSNDNAPSLFRLTREQECTLAGMQSAFIMGCFAVGLAMLMPWGYWSLYGSQALIPANRRAA